MQREEGACMGLEDKSILVVDDDATVLTIVKLFLQKECHVYAVNSGLAAIDFLKKKQADLILLDYEMPVMKGPKVFENIRAMDKYKSTPIVFLTGMADKEEIIRCLALKPYAYVLKPVTYDKLKTVLDDLFGAGHPELEEKSGRNVEINRILKLIDDYEVFDACNKLRIVVKYEKENSQRWKYMQNAVDYLERYEVSSAVVALNKVVNIN